MSVQWIVVTLYNNVTVSRRFFFGFEHIFCSRLFVSLLFFKKSFLEKQDFFCIAMLPLTLFFIYRHDYSFSSGKNGYSVKDSFSLSRGVSIVEINNCSARFFPK